MVKSHARLGGATSLIGYGDHRDSQLRFNRSVICLLCWDRVLGFSWSDSSLGRKVVLCILGACTLPVWQLQRMYGWVLQLCVCNLEPASRSLPA